MIGLNEVEVRKTLMTFLALVIVLIIVLYGVNSLVFILLYINTMST